MAPALVLVTALILLHSSANLRTHAEVVHHDEESHHKSAVSIIGGSSSDIEQHPYQVAIWANREFRDSGALVATDWVITTASILVGFDAETLNVRACSSFATSGGDLFSVSKVLSHPKFRFSNMTFDVSLLRLWKPLMTSPSSGHMTSHRWISLARRPLPSSSTAILSGWGSTTEWTKMSDQLLQASMTLVDVNKCQITYERPLLRTQFCAAAEDVYGPCWGDSGDLLVSEGKLYGLLSWNSGCYDQIVPSVFTDIHKVRPWVIRTIRRHSSLTNK